jgi:hypothetical protein
MKGRDVVAGTAAEDPPLVGDRRIFPLILRHS